MSRKNRIQLSLENPDRYWPAPKIKWWYIFWVIGVVIALIAQIIARV